MNRIFKYYKDRKGITLVWMAFMLAVLLMLAGLAIDIAYMYYVKNQLQVAADAAALAGAAELPDITKARQTAWRFACRNKAGGNSADNPDAKVYLVSNNPSSCDASLDGVDLNNSNTPNGDIVVGNWDPSRPQTPQDLRFCAYNDTCWDATTMTINAVKARPRRTNETPGMPRVRLFIGQIFRIIGADWSAMSARASAIASFSPPTFGPFPICINTCSNLPQTPLTGTPYPGIKLIINPPSGTYDPERIAWTDFQPVPGDPRWTRNKAGDPPGIFELLGVEKQGSNWIVKQPEPPPNQCNSVNCLRTKQGTGNALDAIPAIIAARGKTYTIKGFPIFGWKTMVPVFEPCCPAGPPSTFACPGDQPCGYRLVQVTELIVTGVKLPAGPGEPGIYVVGLDDDPTTTDTDKTKIKCLACDDPTIQSSERVHLVQ